MVQFNARKTTLRDSKFVVFAAFEVGHASFVREALGSMTPNHANLERATTTLGITESREWALTRH